MCSSIFIFCTGFLSLFYSFTIAESYSGNGGTNSKSFFKNEEGIVIAKCSLSYSNSALDGIFQISENELSNQFEDIPVYQREFNGSAFLIDLRLPFNLQADTFSAVLAGIDDVGLNRTITAKCLGQPSLSDGTRAFHMQNIILPPGSYSFICFTPNSKECQYNNGRMLGYVKIPSSDSSSLVKPHHKSKRDSSCEFSNCYSVKGNFTHKFDQKGGRLKFFHNIVGDFCKEKLTLMRYSDYSPTITRKECESFDITRGILRQFETFRCLEDYKDVAEFKNLPTSCYTIKVAGGCFYGFLWLENPNYVDMNSWLPKILIIARNQESSLEVKWSEPPYPFNFKEWRLKVWFMEGKFNVSCIRNNDRKGKLSVIEVPKVIQNNSYTFYNLKQGSYCAILTPVDDKCPSSGCESISSFLHDGCSSRGSYTVRLEEYPSARSPEGGDLGHWWIMLVVLASILMMICIFFLCFRVRTSYSVNQSAYKPVHVQKGLEKINVLLIWTKFNPANRPQMEPLVDALKILLEDYCRCTVYDYLEPRKLPKRESERLLRHPVGWLQTQLASDIKKVFVATEGAALLQSLHLNQESFNSITAQMDDMDARLFPHVLRHIQDSLRCASDYQRIFHVGFDEISDNNVHLDGIVANVRFDLPEHLKQLRLRLHGFTETADIPSPTQDQLEPLRRALDMSKSFV